MACGLRIPINAKAFCIACSFKEKVLTSMVGDLGEQVLSQPLVVLPSESPTSTLPRLSPKEAACLYIKP